MLFVPAAQLSGRTLDAARSFTHATQRRFSRSLQTGAAVWWGSAGVLELLNPHVFGNGIGYWMVQGAGVYAGTRAVEFVMGRRTPRVVRSAARFRSSLTNDARLNGFVVNGRHVTVDELRLTHPSGFVDVDNNLILVPKGAAARPVFEGGLRQSLARFAFKTRHWRAADEHPFWL